MSEQPDIAGSEEMGSLAGRNAVLFTRDMLRIVRLLDMRDRERAVCLNKIARGDDGAALDARQAEELRKMNREMSELLGRVSPHTRRVIEGDAASGSGSAGLAAVGMGSGAIGEMPARVRDLYSLLCLAVYGMDRAGGGGSGADGGIGRAQGKTLVWRDDSGQQTTMNRAKPGKGGGSGKKSKVLVVNDRAFRFKRKIDLRLRRMAVDVETFLAGESGEGKGVRGQANIGRVKTCTKCNKIGEFDWRHCPRCGGTMAA